MADPQQLHCSVLTPDGAVFTGNVQSVLAPAVDGYLQVLVKHAPLITALGKGELRVRDANGEPTSWQVEGGFLEVLNDEVSVLAEKLIQ